MDGHSQNGSEDVCPRCRGRLHGHVLSRCPWCGGALYGVGGDASGGSERLAKRAAIELVVIMVLVGWAMFVPVGDWNAVNGSIFGVISVFMLAITWVLSGELIDD